MAAKKTKKTKKANLEDEFKAAIKEIEVEANACSAAIDAARAKVQAVCDKHGIPYALAYPGRDDIYSTEIAEKWTKVDRELFEELTNGYLYGEDDGLGLEWDASTC